MSPHFCAWQKAPERLHPGWGPSCLCSVAATGPGEGQGSPCSGEAVGWAARWDLLGGCQLGLVHAPFLSLPFSPSQPSPSLSHIQRGGYFRFCVASQPAELGGGVTVTGTRHSEWEPAPKQPRAQTRAPPSAPCCLNQTLGRQSGCRGTLPHRLPGVHGPGLLPSPHTGSLSALLLCSLRPSLVLQLPAHQPRWTWSTHHSPFLGPLRLCQRRSPRAMRKP